jgi:hypothetical protein
MSDITRIPLRILDRSHIADEEAHASLVETDASRVLDEAREKIARGNVAGVVVAYVFDDGRVGWSISASGNIGGMIGAVTLAQSDLVDRAKAAAE